jgi:hypothetical protein
VPGQRDGHRRSAAAGGGVRQQVTGGLVPGSSSPAPNPKPQLVARGLGRKAAAKAAAAITRLV